jgi:hypothetical protein
MPAVLVDDLEKLLVEVCVAVKLFGIEWHANEQVIRKMRLLWRSASLGGGLRQNRRNCFTLRHE